MLCIRVLIQVYVACHHAMQVRRGKVPIKRPQFGNIVADRSEEEQIRLKAQLPREKFWIFG